MDQALDFTYIEDLVDGIVKCIGNKKLLIKYLT